VYLWFGVLKLFPGGSPAQDLVERTVSALTFGIIHGDVARMSAASSEIALVSTPLVLFPGEMWSGPLRASFEAQYILKNLVTVAAAMVIASSHPRVR
jgi:putative oxidoreductase